jgi:ubiquinone/menaquinone biosynthesis C-methylase UbiE
VGSLEKGQEVSDNAGLSGEQDLQSDTLDELTAAVNYRNVLVRLGLPWLGEHAVEIGSGNGDYASEWAAEGQRLTVTEALDSRLRLLRDRFSDEPLVDVEELWLPTDKEASYSAAVAYNVLEHIEDDVAALASMRRLVRVGGHVVIIVPAFELGMSDFDRKIGHFRRYRTGMVKERMREAGLEPVSVRYINFVGLIMWVILVRGLRRAPRNSAALRLYDRLVVPLVAGLESRVQFPFGQSVFAVGERLAD